METLQMVILMHADLEKTPLLLFIFTSCIMTFNTLEVEQTGLEQGYMYSSLLEKKSFVFYWVYFLWLKTNGFCSQGVNTRDKKKSIKSIH